MPKFSHECPDWDSMEIDETCAEFVACGCFSCPCAAEAKERLAMRLDQINVAPETAYAAIRDVMRGEHD